MSWVQTAGLILAVFVVLATALPLAIRGGQWWARLFDYPRAQFLAVGLIALVLLGPSALVDNRMLAVWIITAACALLHFYRVLHYTPLVPPQSLAPSSDDSKARIRMLVANVWMPNRHFDALIEIVRRANPDVFIALETDEAWDRALRPLEIDYPYRVKQPQDDTYGLLFYSKLELESAELRFLVDETIPSVYARVKLRSGDLVDLYALHPEPPQPFNDTYERDAELLLVGKTIKQNPRACIVAGDLNDVAWSHTTRLFQRISGQLDPRVGRGLFNSYHARIPLLRWPLDHVFHSAEFRLVCLQRLEAFGSDHFPILVELSLEPELSGAVKEPTPDEGDSAEADARIENGRS